jgi:predicted DNA-binding transcriptional regulator AlpA
MSNRSQPSNAVAVENSAVAEREAAPYLGMTTSWLRKGRRDGTGPPYIRIGRSVRYILRDLDSYRERRRVEPKPKARASEATEGSR